MKKVLYFILGIIIILLIAFIVVINLPQASTKNKAANFSMDAKELFSAYSGNEANANAKYNGKVIEVSGKLMDISEDEQGATVLLLDSGDDFGGILCTLDNTPKKMPSIGQELKIKGQCNGILMDVVLSKCHIISK